MKHFPVDFQLVITAEDVKSYKPAPAHFNKAREKIGSRKWLHVAGSLYHDIQPTYKLGIDSIWVNRKHVKPSLTSANSVKRKVTDLDELTRILT
jgi:2-haloacid dehalogenase/putative hydrolase of the HAD superfamily